ncbi:DoxX family protein [Nonomuraea rhizosphaerae]|uniref:DoxX family protein n=1 Tax=Nonomuraea rhizosphaerae TaxID=2665663 RepID=UPI001C5DC12E|nr:DoxX family protein [Nonomuraea rhizosphaerae]
MRKVVFDLAVLISRVTIGVIFVTHGVSKWQQGLPSTAAGLETSGVPLPWLSAIYTTLTESVGGALLIVGLLTRLSSLSLLIGMLGAIVYVHGAAGVMIPNGWELVGSLAVTALLLLVVGAGRISLDSVLRQVYARRSTRYDADQADTIPLPWQTIREMYALDAVMADEAPRDGPPGRLTG